ncbi:cytoplasmic tRNA 2-thiolation protein 2-like [Rhagoletis pomonella]|uniref:cytoplasmic tRNA 2-thiolation protein 2-like n=1 Tax=Rhagoletis pomonella TaxID=28610 RepID=UPI001785D679|nr:cytoplasmic tRNA 2-thiolation protein 2-like [Rhagoletis pomonella]
MYKLFYKEPKCKGCLQYVNHKFRAAVGSSKALPRNANILLVFDGSAQAVVLLDILQKAHTETSFKRLHCDFKILFIDDCALTPRHIRASNSISYVQKVQELFLSYKGPEAYIINLSCEEHQKPFDIINLGSYLSRGTDREIVFTNTLLNIRSSTSRSEVIKVHRNKLIASVAQGLNCKYVFIPSINVNIAADLLAAIVLGRDNDAALDVAFLDDRMGNGVKFMRPIKDLSEWEVMLYMHGKGLKPIKTPFNSQSTVSQVCKAFGTIDTKSTKKLRFNGFNNISYRM